ncbi:3-hydroxyacyl-CoA dehydrogenase family protein [Streptacidiphilus sp. P02-A3a]|uniref:3-hydroxyacyl-CoA dehydrogenase family protein n=1 Tax=Streptacidiphilus sp. P02-A3a TaxID=2704468 RepID=UPI0015F9FAF6|nr:3-hydroxyacyl-CoA dehydrogenase family protein [Streptacidiphilus sp. P02-A3a]QMU67389.1 3-hydroxyacyl-CoA dehydrogenase family protein [Streptacidiphilus sp. P02-A3a]
MNDLTVGVVGAGVMGSSLAQSLTAAGIGTVLYDSDPQARTAAGFRVAAASRLARLSAARADAGPPGRLTVADALTELSGCDLVIENVVEDPEVKRQVHVALDAVLKPGAVVAVNTSAVPVSGLALATDHPERMVGAHFMNPVAASVMVEVVRTPYTAAWALRGLEELLRRLGKESVVVDDQAGFVINRCLMMFISEAAALVDDGVATAREVDRLFRACLGHRTGPLRTADLIGIDTIVHTIDVLRDHYGPERFTPSPALLRMADAGRLGRKTGEGFYHYSDGETP